MGGGGLGYYVLGYVTDMQATEAAKARGLMSVMRGFKKTLDKKQHPQLFRVSDKAIEQMLTGRDAHERFEFGLQVVLRGLKGAGRAKRRL